MSEPGNCSRPFCMALRREGYALPLCASCSAAVVIVPVVRMLLHPVGYAYELVEETLTTQRLLMRKDRK